MKYALFQGNRMDISKDPETGLWKDQYGTIWAYREESSSVDPIDRCGVGWFSLPVTHPLTDACRPHEFMYSSPAFQAFHTRSEADEALKQLASKISGYEDSITPDILELVSRELGFHFWENPKTND